MVKLPVNLMSPNVLLKTRSLILRDATRTKYCSWELDFVFFTV